MSVLSARLHIALLIFMIPAVLPSGAKKTSMKMKTPDSITRMAQKRKNSYNAEPVQADSLTFAAVAPHITFSGFDKPYNGRRETFLVSNGSDRHISGLEIRIVYLDLQDRMLHSRDEEIMINIPSGETRQVSLKSFDSQSTYYYIKSRPPRSGGQPFYVKINPVKVFFPR